MDERYLSQIERSRTSAKPLPLEVIENVQEPIWSGISGSVKAVLHRIVDMALADEATERVGAGRHERTPERRAHRNGTYTRDLATTLGPIEDLQVPRIRMPGGSSPGGWATFDRYERRTYELDRLIRQLFLAGVSGRNLERVSAELWGKKVSRSTVSRATEAFEDEQRAINEARSGRSSSTGSGWPKSPGARDTGGRRPTGGAQSCGRPRASPPTRCAASSRPGTKPAERGRR